MPLFALPLFTHAPSCQGSITNYFFVRLLVIYFSIFRKQRVVILKKRYECKRMSDISYFFLGKQCKVKDQTLYYCSSFYSLYWCVLFIFISNEKKKKIHLSNFHWQTLLYKFILCNPYCWEILYYMSTGYQSENLDFYQVMVIVMFSFSQVYDQTLKFLWIFVFNPMVNSHYITNQL